MSNFTTWFGTLLLCFAYLPHLILHLILTWDGACAFNKAITLSLFAWYCPNGPQSQEGTGQFSAFFHGLPISPKVEKTSMQWHMVHYTNRVILQKPRAKRKNSRLYQLKQFTIPSSWEVWFRPTIHRKCNNSPSKYSDHITLRTMISLQIYAPRILVALGIES